MSSTTFFRVLETVSSRIWKTLSSQFNVYYSEQLNDYNMIAEEKFYPDRFGENILQELR